MTDIILASSSPRRAAILKQAGIVFDVISADIDETPLVLETPEAYVIRMAKAKAKKIGTKFSDKVVIGADTIVVIGDCIFGKPNNIIEAKKMWSQLSGGWHEVITAVAISGKAEMVTAQRSRVLFKPITEEMMDYYWSTGEPNDKAGGYAIQGMASAWVVELKGSYTGVMGLPVYETIKLLKDNGIKVPM